MSIPGLGQIPTQAAVPTTRTITLRPAWEFRFTTSFSTPLTIKLLSGTAEKDGVELAPRHAYIFRGARTRILTWQGCELEIEGRTEEEHVKEYTQPTDNPANALLNLHAKLEELRAQGKEGPRVLITGPKDAGKTVATRTLTSYATRQGFQPLTVNVNPREGMLSLPGTLSAAVFATVMDPETGWGSTPTSGPSTTPVKLPLVYYYGRERAEEEPEFFKEIVGKLAGTVSGRLSEDDDVKRSGVFVDGFGVEEGSEVGMDLIDHVVDEFSINIVVVIGSSSLQAELEKKYTNEKTSLGEAIHVIIVDKSDGANVRNETFIQHVREAAIKEYFFGDSRRTLSPQIQQVDFDSIVVYKVPDYKYEPDTPFSRQESSEELQHWALAVTYSSPRDIPEAARAASIIGFVYVADVDEEKRKVKVLAPVGGRLGDRPLIWGRWPEPYINLLG